MRKLKLASLALVMFISAVGAYGNYKSLSVVYYIEPGTLPWATTYKVAAAPPGENCGGSAEMVCTVIASEGYNIGDLIPGGDATIFTLYN